MFDSMSVPVLAGLFGFVAYVLPFALVQVGRLDGNSRTFTVCNMTASALVLISMLDQFNLGSALTQVTWLAMGLLGLARRMQSSEKAPAAATTVAA